MVEGTRKAPGEPPAWGQSRPRKETKPPKQLVAQLASTALVPRIRHISSAKVVHSPDAVEVKRQLKLRMRTDGQLFSAADGNRDNKLSFDEFKRGVLMMGVRPSPSESVLRTLFDEYDQDADGWIQWAELHPPHQNNDKRSAHHNPEPAPNAPVVETAIPVIPRPPAASAVADAMQFHTFQNNEAPKTASNPASLSHDVADPDWQADTQREVAWLHSQLNECRSALTDFQHLNETNDQLITPREVLREEVASWRRRACELQECAGGEVTS